MTPAWILALGSLGLFSLADWRYRVAPGVSLFLLFAALLSGSHNCLPVGLVLWTVLWSLRRAWPLWLVLPALLHPASWGVVLAGAGYRQGLLGRADLLALGGLACLFEWPALVTALLGVEFWRRAARSPEAKVIPALPGMLLGSGIYGLWQLLFRG